jgi:hypothetical protein
MTERTASAAEVRPPASPYDAGNLDQAAAATNHRFSDPMETEIGELHEFTVTCHLTGRSGVFVSKIPTEQELGRFEISKAALTEGLPWTSFDPAAQNYKRYQAACMHFLAKRPDWFAEDFMGAKVMSHVIMEVGKRCIAHRDEFLAQLAAKSDAAEKAGAFCSITPMVGSRVPAAGNR